MAIEINGLPGSMIQGTGEGGRTGQTADATQATNVGRSTPGEQFSLTDSAARLRELEREVAKLPVVDSHRVSEVQRSMATGSFQIDPSQVADKMLSMEKALG